METAGTGKSNKMEIELVNFNKLEEYTEGKSQSATENFVVDINSQDIQQVGDSGQKVKKKGFLSQLKEKIGGAAASNATPSQDENVVFGTVTEQNMQEGAMPEAGQAPPVPQDGRAEEGGSVLSTKTIIKLVVLLIILVGLGAGFLFLPQLTSQPEKSSVEIVTDFSHSVINRGENVVNILTDKKPDVGDLSLNQISQQELESVDLERINIQQTSRRGLQKKQVATITVTKNQVANQQEESKLNQAWREIIGSEQKITSQNVYSYIEDFSTNLTQERVYFLEITDANGIKLTLDEFLLAMGMRLPAWKTNVQTYELMIFLEPQTTTPTNKIRIGLLLTFISTNKPTFSSLKSWESTIIDDLSPLYLSQNRSLLDKSKNFNNSSISETRRFVNFTQDQSLSLDYALAQDGLIVVTSKNFGTAILNVLVQNSQNGAVN